jgi:hypothetical protein
MLGKRFVVKLVLGILLITAITVGYLALGVNSREFTKSACACVTVNMHVVGRLDQLDYLVQQYAAEHYGEFPTYEELLIIAAGEGIDRGLTPQVDSVSGEFTFVPTRDDASKIGYAVFADRRSYILIGIGLTEKYRAVSLYGREVGKQLIGFEFPILRSGDTPPEPSPFS